MKETLLRVFVNRHFILAFLSAPAVFFILNIGIIFNIPNRFDILPELINFLSTQIDNKSALSLFTASISVFILFFTFTQFAKSNTFLNGKIVLNYILHDKKTKIFLGVQLSFLFMLGYFVCFNSIHYLNHILCVLFVFLLIVYSVLYFYRFVGTISPLRIFEIILNKLIFKDSVESINFNNNLNNNRETFNNLTNGVTNFEVVIEKEFLWENKRNHYSIQTRDPGVIKNIKLNNIIEILKKFKNNIKRIGIIAKIGDSFPREWHLLKEDNNYTLMTIELNNPTSDCSNNNFHKFINFSKNKNKLIKCFEIDNKILKQEKQLNKTIDDLFDFYLQSIETRSYSPPELFFSAFTENKIFLKDNSFEVRNDILSKFSDLLRKKIYFINLDRDRFATIYAFIFHFMSFSIEQKCFELFKKAIELLHVLNCRNIREPNILLKDNCIFPAELNDIYRKLSLDIIDNQEWKSFYQPLIIESLGRSIEALMYMVDDFDLRNENDNKENFIKAKESIQQITNHFKYNESIKKLFESNNKELYSYKDEISESYNYNIIFFTFLLIEEVKNKNMPSWLLIDIAFPLCESSMTLRSSNNRNSIEDMTRLFFDPAPTLNGAKNIHNKPIPENISEDYCWFLFSIYLANKGIEFPMNLSNNHNLNNAINARIQSISTFNDSDRRQFVERLFNCTSEVYQNYINNYLTRLKNLRQ